MAADSQDPQRPEPRRWIASRWWTAAGWCVYAISVLALTYPVVLDPASTLISQWPTDADHSLWVQWWFARAIESPELALFQTDMLRFPDTTNLHLADLNLFVNGLFYLLSKPFGAIGAYNAMLWGSFLASAGLMWRLGRRISGDAVAGWLSGLVYASSSYWIASALNSWTYLVHIWVFPLVALAIARAARHRRRRDFVALGVALGLVFHVTPYYFLFVGVLLAALTPWFARDAVALARTRAGAIGLATTALVTGCIVLPRAWPMLQAGAGDLAVHSGPTDVALAAQWLEFFVHRVERPGRLRNGTFLIAFFGYTLMAVIAYGIAISKQRAVYRRWLVAAAIVSILALGPRIEFDDGSQWLLPGNALLSLPGFRFMTNHWRWTLPAHFCLAVAFSIALADLRLRVPAFRNGIAVGVTAVFLAEVWFVFPFPHPRPLWPKPYDAFSPLLRADDSIDAVLDLRPRSKIRQTVHGKRIVGGWLPRVDSGSVDRTQRLMEQIRISGDQQAERLHRLGIGAIVVDERTGFRVVAGPRGAFELRPLRAN